MGNNHEQSDEFRDILMGGEVIGNAAGRTHLNLPSRVDEAYIISSFNGYWREIFNSPCTLVRRSQRILLLTSRSYFSAYG